jgi:hypothetical protein
MADTAGMSIQLVVCFDHLRDGEKEKAEWKMWSLQFQTLRKLTGSCKALALSTWNISYFVRKLETFRILSENLKHFVFCSKTWNISYFFRKLETFRILSENLKHFVFCPKTWSISYFVRKLETFRILSENLKHFVFCQKTWNISYFVRKLHWLHQKCVIAVFRFVSCAAGLSHSTLLLCCAYGRGQDSALVDTPVLELPTFQINLSWQSSL